ncbi:hypothetical protein BT69DRAFT_1317354, partial [Atractiella rhizophila]
MSRRIFNTRTYLSSSPSALVSALSSLAPAPSSSVTLCTLPSTLPASSLSNAIITLRSKFPNLIGCISGPLGFDGWEHKHSVALATAEICGGTGVNAFRTHVVGMQKTTVGREGIGGNESSRRKPMSSSLGLETQGEEEPSNGFEGLEKISEQQVQQIIYFSDDTPHNFLQRLNQHFPRAQKLGLIGAATPFLTGRPFTFFRNEQSFSDCQVGLTISTHAFSSARINYPPMQVLGNRAFAITKARGNVVETLDNYSATAIVQSIFNEIPGDQKDVALYGALYT